VRAERRAERKPEGRSEGRAEESVRKSKTPSELVVALPRKVYSPSTPLISSEMGSPACTRSSVSGNEGAIAVITRTLQKRHSTCIGEARSKHEASIHFSCSFRSALV
jgi:hypothetical protein